MKEIVEALRRLSEDPRMILAMLQLATAVHKAGGSTLLVALVQATDLAVELKSNPFRALAKAEPSDIASAIELITALIGDGVPDEKTPEPSGPQTRTGIVRKLLIGCPVGSHVQFHALVDPVFTPEDGMSKEEEKKKRSEIGAALVQQFKKDGLLAPVVGRRGLYVRVDPGKRKLAKLKERS